MSLLLQLAKDVISSKLKSVLSPMLLLALSVGSGFDKGMKALGGDLAAGTALANENNTKKTLDNLVQIDGPHEYLKDYAYFERKDWARALLALDAVESGTITLLEISSSALSGYEIIVFSVFDATVRDAKVAAKLQKRGEKVPEEQMTKFIEAIARMAEATDARYRQATSASQRVRAQ